MHKVDEEVFAVAMRAATLANGAIKHNEIRQDSERESMVKAYEQQNGRSYDTDMQPLDENNFALDEEEDDDEDFRFHE